MTDMRTMVLNITITKVDRILAVDLSAINDELYEHGLHKGFDNILNDANSSATKKSGATDDAIFAMSEKALQALYDGTFKVRDGKDAVKTEAIKIVIAHKEKEFAGLDDKAKKAKALEYIARNPAYTHLAQANIDAVEKARKEAAAATQAALAGMEKTIQETLVPTA